MQLFPDAERPETHSLNYAVDGWSICVLASGASNGRTTSWRIHGKRDSIQFHATGGTLAEAWRNAAMQALDRLAEERSVLHTPVN